MRMLKYIMQFTKVAMIHSSNTYARREFVLGLGVKSSFSSLVEITLIKENVNECTKVLFGFRTTQSLYKTGIFVILSSPLR